MNLYLVRLGGLRPRRWWLWCSHRWEVQARARHESPADWEILWSSAP